MVSLALFLGVSALVWLLVMDHYDRKIAKELEREREMQAFTDWADWMEPNEDDRTEWDFPDRDAA